MIWQNFNINSKVRARLNQKGKSIFVSYQAKMGNKLYLPTEDAEGWSEFKMREFMEVFGYCIYTNEILPFEPIIQFQEEK